MRFFARRLLLLGTVFAALAMLMTPALAGADDDDDDDGGGGGDAAFCEPAGTPQIGQCSIPGTLDFDFDASSGPLGQNPMGSFFFESLPFRREGNVTCLQVTGDRASVGGVITASTTPSEVGQGYAFTVLDNTPPVPDQISVLFSFQGVIPVAPGPTTPDCGSVRPPTNNVTGNIVVQDDIAGGGDDDDDDDDDDGDDD